MRLLDHSPFQRKPVALAPSSEPPIDIVTAAVRKSLCRTQGQTLPTTADLNCAREIANAVRWLPDAPPALERLLAFVVKFPDEERFQTMVARVLERVQDPGALGVWRGIDERFPQSREAFLRLLRCTVRSSGLDAGQSLHMARFKEEPSDPFQLLIYGRGLMELKDFVEAEEAFTQLVAMENTPESVLLDLGSVYASQGQPMRALEIVEFASEKFGETRKVIKTRERISGYLRSLEEIVPAHADTTRHPRNLVIERVFENVIELREARLGVEPRRFVGPVVLINGSLGPGGAERQFTNTALGLNTAARKGTQIGGCDVIGPIYIICRSLRSRMGADFFAPEFVRAGIPVREYSRFPELGGRPRLSRVRQIIDAVEHLPTQMREGIVHLTDMLCYINPDVIHIWQDGSVFATGLAALLAGVPRIVLSVRTLPPPDRFGRNKPEYEAIYRSMLSARGVSLVANSHAAGERYEAWLDLQRGSVKIIPNGVAPLNPAEDSATKEMAKKFDVRCPAYPFTVGSVMRFDDNKRPLLWLDTAAALAARRKDVRFIIVGDGPLHEEAVEYAKELGIEDRVLFPGRSSKVGYWLSRMDAFLLLSRHEGLPNGLIESQFAGVPVVTTPAGGAAETLEPGVTGTILPSIDGLDVGRIADEILLWRREPGARAMVATMISDWAQERFSLSRMLELTVSTYLELEGLPHV